MMPEPLFVASKPISAAQRLHTNERPHLAMQPLRKPLNRL